jgi:hypothetical protein
MIPMFRVADMESSRAIAVFAAFGNYLLGLSGLRL